MLVKTYFERLYTHMREELYYPNRKNSGIFVVRCFCAAGSNYFPFKKGKRYTSKDVPLPRKLYDGSRTMTTDIKASFHPFDDAGLKPMGFPPFWLVCVKHSFCEAAGLKERKAKQDRIAHTAPDGLDI